MDKIKFKIQNLIFRSDSLPEEHYQMLYRGAQLRYYPMASAFKLLKNDFVEFFTYFNSFSYAKWVKYTNIGEVYLRIKCKGKFTIQMFGHYREGRTIKKEFYPIQHFDSKDYTEVKLPIPTNASGQVIGFQIQAFSEMWLAEGGWYTEIPRSSVNDVRISISTTTFKKEDYIKRNIGILERELFYSGEACRDHFRLRVVDNGRTLDPDEFNSEYVTVFPNENVGGAGGYTRGMLESLRSEDFPATHVLLMDDDVLVTAESFIRLYSLLALVKPAYRDRFVSGAMLYFENMCVQHEDVGFVHKDGSYGPNKPIMDMSFWDSVFRNDEDIEFHKNSYAGWWYCCIPVSKINTEHLPVPLFIRGDDVEFSIANHAEFLTLNGICIWHKGFVNKFNAALELYLVHRNSLVIQAMSGVASNIDFVERIDGFFRTNIMRLAYNNCELLLDAIEDYLNGPDFLMTPQGERIMKEKGAKNERMINVSALIDEVDGIVPDRLFDDMYAQKPLKGFKRWWYNTTWNGHIMPKCFLSSNTAVIPYDWFYSDGRQYMCKNVLAISENGTANLRERSRRTFLALMKRRKKLLKRYNKEKRATVERYRTAAKTLQSKEFWSGYLGI